MCFIFHLLDYMVYFSMQIISIRFIDSLSKLFHSFHTIISSTAKFQTRDEIKNAMNYDNLSFR